MTRVLGIDPDFSEVRVGTFEEGSDAGISLCSLGAGEDPFEWYRATRGQDPSVVAIAGGSYAPSPPGAYSLDSRLASDAARIDSWHPRNRMTVRAFEYCSAAGIRCVVLDPMSSADIAPESRLSGYPRYERRGIYYAVPQRQAYQMAVRSLGLDHKKAPIITVYLGDEVAVAAHLGERVLDTSDPVACEGPFGFTSAGTAPATAFISWLFREEKSVSLTLEALKRRSGAFAYAGVSTMSEFRALLSENPKGALAVVDGMAYQVSKEIGREMAALRGEARAVVLTGPGATLDLLTSSIEERVCKWCEVVRIQEDLCIPALVREGLNAASVKSLLHYRGEKRS